MFKFDDWFGFVETNIVVLEPSNREVLVGNRISWKTVNPLSNDSIINPTDSSESTVLAFRFPTTYHPSSLYQTPMPPARPKLPSMFQGEHHNPVAPIARRNPCCIEEPLIVCDIYVLCLQVRGPEHGPTSGVSECCH